MYKKILYISIAISFFQSTLFSMNYSDYPLSVTWNDLLEYYKTCMNKDTYTLLMQQYNEFISKKSPAIASDIIKKIKIKECNEELVDLKTSHNERIGVMDCELLIKAHYFEEDIDPRGKHYGYVRKGVYNALCRLVEEFDRIAPDFGYEVGALDIKLFEGLRDLETQKKLFDTKLADLKAKNPELTYEEVYKETSKWVSPYENNVPTHSTGAAIDIGVYNKKTSRFCDMGRFNTGGSTAPTFSDDTTISPEQKKNRLLLLIAATNAGLVNYAYEFWHYSYGDRYYAYFREPDSQQCYAMYDAIQNI